MIKAESIISKRYAQAFLNVFGERFTLADTQKLISLARVLKENKTFAVFLEISSIKYEEKEALIKKIWSFIEIPQEYFVLVNTLLYDKRILLLACVLHDIVELYKKRMNIATFTITSAHALSEQDLTDIQHFLARHTGCRIMYNYALDKNLIAGLRLQSDTVLWEHSLDKKLRTIGLSLIH